MLPKNESFSKSLERFYEDRIYDSGSLLFKRRANSIHYKSDFACFSPKTKTVTGETGNSGGPGPQPTWWERHCPSGGPRCPRHCRQHGEVCMFGSFAGSPPQRGKRKPAFSLSLHCDKLLQVFPNLAFEHCMSGTKLRKAQGQD